MAKIQLLLLILVGQMLFGAEANSEDSWTWLVRFEVS